ncbi:H4MPT-linked C1 transfer pathway protein [Thiorhodococcus drewsii AZ1]|uniref:H4MPT-linked C1 transfer pathway protein n=1 Tax=Thiorhodococcus drewsii AZ1 TaxID=765913 RepID=G2DX11_9GAMM|nr:hydantoinase/oxoprolinase family protein [Thiorhodococcus drewsii]EGV33365.1 H4MPT-linked C1 transfer pathway protein [Thiorhodococcus drewsii AZ1]
MPETWIGWDLGGANLKAVQLDAAGRALEVVQVACPLWQGVEHLHAGIDRVLERLVDPRPHRHAVTMTGELADLFEGRNQGVATLVSVMRERLGEEPLLIYAGAAGFVDPARAVDLAHQVASANWMASAALAASIVPEGLLIDIGSTTTDLVPFAEGAVSAWGTTDHERLRHGELLYAGVGRTPLMSLAQRAPFDGVWVPLMAEHFATTGDVYRLTGELPDHADLLPSADGREKTPMASARRLARMLGLDVEAADQQGWQRLAEYLAEVQLQGLMEASACLLSRGELVAQAPILGAGVGRFLARRLAERLGRPYIGFESLFAPSEVGAPDMADCAPAAALARLAAMI